MLPEDLRSLLTTSGVDLWTLIDAAVSVAARDHAVELRARRDQIVDRLYCNRSLMSRCQKCDPIDDPRLGAEIEARSNGRDAEENGSSSPLGKEGAAAAAIVSGSPLTPQSMNSIDDEKSKILAIKDFLDDEDQSEDSVVSLLQNLADMDITFKALKETDIGRNVNGLRKHTSAEVRRLVKQLVRKWKETVEEWAKSISPGGMNAGGSGDNDPVPDFGYSPNPHNGSSEHFEYPPKGIVQRESQPKPQPKPSTTTPNFAPSDKGKEQESLLDPERLASARRRLHENYQEADNAKKQRTIQVMDIHEIPRPKNSFIAREKGAPHKAKHW